MRYEEFYQRSIEQPEAFWAEQAQRIHWHTPPERILDVSRPPFRRWFVGGTTNLCYNAVDRHLPARGGQLALVAISSETGITRELSYRDLYREVNTFAAVLASLGVGTGDRVVIYLPNIAEAVFAMLACARIGAIHSVVFGGFAAHNLALRIDDAEPALLIAADAGMRGGKVIPYKPLVDAALEEAKRPPPRVLMIDRGLDPQMTRVAGRDLDYASLRASYEGAEVPVAWLESNEPSYLLYTSGTTGKPKGIQRDVGGYAVAMAMSIETIFDIKPGQVMFSTSDVGWAVGHSYNVYAPLIGGATSLLYEGLPAHPDPGIWWRLCERYGVRSMFSSPTAIRTEKAGRQLAEKVRPVPAQMAVPRRRTARRTDRALGHRRTRRAGDRQLLADRNRLAGDHLDARPRLETGEVRLAGIFESRLSHESDRRSHRRGASAEPERRAGVRAAVAAGLPHHRMAQRRTLRGELFQPLQGAAL